MNNYIREKNIKNIPQFECQDYYLFKDNFIYKVILEIINNEIIIEIQKYKFTINNNNLTIFFKEDIDTIDKAYKFLNSLFEENKVEISNIIYNKEIKLNCKLNNDNRNEVEIILYYDINNKNYIVNEINKIKNNINFLKIENYKLKKEIEILKSYNIKNKNIKLLKEIKTDSYACTNLDNMFSVFKSINNILYLIYSNKYNSIISYDLINEKIVTEIKKCHNQNISNLRHFLDKKNNQDLLMSISFRDNNIKLWNICNWECILNLSEVNKNGFLDSACFLVDNNNYIITSNCYWGGYSEYIKVFDFNGNKIKEICSSNERTYFIDNYYDNINKKNYIITGNENYVKSYDYNNNKLYHKYYEYDNRGHFSIEICCDDNIIKLIESCFDGIIRIWNFHYNILLNKITVSNKALFGISLLNNNNLLVGCEDKTIKLIELKNGGIVQNLQSHYKWVISIKRAIHPKYGELIISQGYDNDKIRLWINNN